MLDRTKQPEFKIISDINIPEIKQQTLSHNVPLIFINAGKEEIIRLLINFNAGTWHQPKRLVASTTLKMLTEGTETKSALQIAEIINFYGAEIKHRRGTHHSYLMVTVLNKFLEPILQLLNDILNNPTFPEKEMRIYLNNQKQEYLIELENVEVVARNLFNAAVFGFEHPYGTYALIEDFDKVQPQDLIDFYSKYFHRSNLSIFAGGKISDKQIHLIDKYLTNIPDGNPTEEPDYKYNPAKDKYIYKPKESSLQSAILIGNRTIGIDSNDYFKLHFTNVLLGGYFGSRLMTNIREEKGLTYGIYSSYDVYPRSGLFAIEASVRKENKDLVIDEIRKEIQKLKQKGAADSELITVKNYVISQLLRLINGVFPITHYISHLYKLNLNQDFIKRYVREINKIDNKDVIETAEKYLCFDDFYKIVVG